MADHNRKPKSLTTSSVGARRVSGTEPTAWSSPDQDEVLTALLELSVRRRSELSVAEVVAQHLAVLGELLPGRAVSITVLDAAEAIVHRCLPPEMAACPDRVQLSEAAIIRRGFTPETVRAGPRAEVVATLDPDRFEDGKGFDSGLIVDGWLLGTVRVEYERAPDNAQPDVEAVEIIARHLGAAVTDANTARRRARRMTYLGNLIDHASVAFAVVGRRRQIELISEGFLNMARVCRETTIGTDFVKMFDEADRARLSPTFINALRGEPSANVEVRLLAPDGSRARMALSTSPIRGISGQVDGVLLVGQDLTNVRDLEDQMIQAHKLATLGQLAAGVVHELNNPLTSISVYSDFLLKKMERRPDTEENDLEKLRRILDSADRILRFTRDLVTYARPTSEEPRPVHIRDVIEQAVVFCEHVLEDAGAEITRHYEDELPEIFGVKGQLHQVFINLITNACQAMPEGAGQLRIRTVLETGGTIRVDLADNGAGIPPDHVGRVFEPFFSTKSEGKGTGLGLSIVRNIVEQHSGAISVQSEIGSGTVFSVIFPGGPVSSG